MLARGGDRAAARELVTLARRAGLDSELEARVASFTAPLARWRVPRVSRSALLHAVDAVLASLETHQRCEGAHGALDPDRILLWDVLSDAAEDEPVDVLDLGPPAASFERETPHRYASPEQIHGRAATPADDVYAIGLMLFEQITGQPPASRRAESQVPIARLVVRLDQMALAVAGENLAPVLARAMDQRALRYSDAAALRHALNDIG